MGKAKSFADKMNKTAQAGAQCPECGEAYATVKLIRAEKSEKTEAWRFKEQFVGVCKCNAESVTQ